MRLIDADKLIDYFYYGIDDKPIIDGISDRKIIAIIKNQTTAYSVDKVVEELDSLRITGNSLKFDLIPYDEAIEIFKQSGVLGDVCECRLIKGYNFLHKTSCGNVFDMENGFKYCPYCGKKIKVVE